MKRLTARIFMFLLALLMFLIPAYGADLINDSLEGTADNGTNSGGLFYTGYNGGKGLYLQNNATLTYAVSNLNPAAGTIELYIKPDWRGENNITHNLVKYTGDVNGEISIKKTSANELEFKYNSLTITTDNSDDWVKDEWHNIALTWDNSSNVIVLTAYVDGLKVGKVTGSVTPVDVEGDMVFGTESGGSIPGTTFDEIIVSDEAKRFDELSVNQKGSLGSKFCYFAEGAVGNAVKQQYTLDQEYPGYFPSNISLTDARKEFYVFNPNYDTAQIKISFYDTNGKVDIDDFGPQSTYAGNVIDIPPLGRYIINVGNNPPPNHNCTFTDQSPDCPVPEFAPYLDFDKGLYGYVQLTGDREYSTVIESTNGVGIAAFSSNTNVDSDINTTLTSIFPQTISGFADGENAVTKPSTTWHFPWASTLIAQYNHKAGKEYNVFCETYLYVFNPQAEDAVINLDLLFSDSSLSINNALLVPAGTRRTLKLSSLPEVLADRDFALSVTSTEAVVASKMVFYNTYGRPFWRGVGTHGLTAPSTGLYTGDFNTIGSADSDIFIMNPHNDNATLQIALATSPPKPDFYLKNNPDYIPGAAYDADDDTTWQYIAVMDTDAVVTIPPKASVRIPLRALAMQKNPPPPRSCPYGAEDDDEVTPCGCILMPNETCPIFDPAPHNVCSIKALPNQSGKTLGVIYEHSLSWWFHLVMDQMRNGNFVGFEDTFDDYAFLPDCFQDDLTPVRLAPNGIKENKKVTRKYSGDGDVPRVTGQNAVYGAAVDLRDGNRIWYPMSADNATLTEIDDVNNTRCRQEKFSQHLFYWGSGTFTPLTNEIPYVYIGFWFKPDWGAEDNNTRVLLHIGEYTASLLDSTPAGANQIVVYKDSDNVLRYRVINTTGSVYEAVFSGYNSDNASNTVEWVQDRWYFITIGFRNTPQMEANIRYYDGAQIIRCKPDPVALSPNPPVHFPETGQQISLGSEIPDGTNSLLYPSNAVFDKLEIAEKFGAIYQPSETMGVDFHFMPLDHLAKSMYSFFQYSITALSMSQGYTFGGIATQFNANPAPADSLSVRWTYFDPLGKQLWVNCTSPYRWDNKICGSQYRKDSHEVVDIGPMDTQGFEHSICINDEVCLISGTVDPRRLIVYGDSPYDEPPISTVKFQAFENSIGRRVPFVVGGPTGWAYDDTMLISGTDPGIDRPTLYVDNATGDDENHGKTWLAAKQTIQAAINAVDNSTGAVIFVAGDNSTTPFVYNDNESITLKQNVILMGGYPSGGGERNVEKYQTIIDGGNFSGPVVVGADCAVLDGFTIQNGSSSANGGGILCDGTSPTIRNCTIKNNHAVYAGGGIYIVNGSPSIINNTINYNQAWFIGGICVYGSSSPVIRSNRIIANIGDAGSGMGIYGNASTTTIATNNLIASNSSVSGQSAVGIDTSGSAFLINNTIANNSDDGGITAIAEPGASIEIANCILWGNGVELVGINESMISYSDIDQEGFEGTNGNIRQNPAFVNPTAGDYHLQATSPCIDNGTSENAPASDIEGNLRYDVPGVPNSGGGSRPYYDMGAYEFVNTDWDNDGISDDIDNCPGNCNTQQLDADNDTIGDVCDPEPGCGCEPECEEECSL